MTTKRMKVSLLSIGAQHAVARTVDSLKVLTLIVAAGAIALDLRSYEKQRFDYDRDFPGNNTSATPARISATASITPGVIFSPSSNVPSSRATTGLTRA